MPHGGHTGPRGSATPSRRQHGAQGTGHVPTAARRGPRYRPRTHGSHTGPRGPATHQRQPHVAPGTNHAPSGTTLTQTTGHAPTAGTQPWRFSTLKRRPHQAQATDHAPTAATPGPCDRHAPMAATPGLGDRPCPQGTTQGLGDLPRPHDNHAGPRAPDTPPQQQHKAQGTGHAFTAATRGPGDWPPPTPATRGPKNRARPNGATRGQGDRQRLHSGHTRPSEPATPPRQQHKAQGTVHAFTAAKRGSGDQPRP